MAGYTVKKRGIQTVNKTFSLSLTALNKLNLMSKRHRSISDAVSRLIERCVDDEGQIVTANPSIKEILFDKYGDVNPVTWGELSDDDLILIGKTAPLVFLHRQQARQKATEQDQTDSKPLEEVAQA